jgi:small GTP-binding protein
MSENPVAIAVVGHTNTGKTSLLRTLARDSAFGEVSDRPGTTRDVRSVVLNDVDGKPVVELYDTPGLEDAVGLITYMRRAISGQADPVAEIDVFIGGDHDRGRYEQEAKVLRQMRRSDAGIYVIDVRESMLSKHREELRLLTACGRPLMPLLNFTASPEARTQDWKDQLARMALHIVSEFDTVVFDGRAEHIVYEKLGALLEARRGNFRRLAAARERQRSDLVDAGSRSIAELLVNCAGARVEYPADGPADAAAKQLRESVVLAEQQCVDCLLELFRFDLSSYEPPQLPLQHLHWQFDPFDPATLLRFAAPMVSNAAKGAAVGLAVDAMTGMVSLGAGTLIGAGIGASWDLASEAIRTLRGRGVREIALDENTLSVLAARQFLLLNALLRRGHATQESVQTGDAPGWPSTEVRKATLRCRAHPEWSALNHGDHTIRDVAVKAIAVALRQVVLGVANKKHA